MQLAEGSGQKGGGLGDALQGAIKRYITPAWETARDSAYAGKNYVSVIALNYMDKIKTLASGAGLRGLNAQQNLQSILYGLAVLTAALNMGLFQMVPGLTLYLINMLSSIATTAATLLGNPIFQDAVLKMTAAAAAYRYRDIPVGAYGVISSTAAPIFTALYARGDQAFQEAFPDFVNNMAASGEAQLQMLKDQLIGIVEAGRAQLQATVDVMQPGIDAIKGVGEAWRNYVNDSIKKLINGLALAQTDMDAIIAYYTFLEEVGQKAKDRGVEIPEETAAEIAGLIDPRIHSEINYNNLVTGAVAMGDLVSNEMDIDANEAAALLLALGNYSGNGNGAEGVEGTDNVSAAAASPAGGRALRRRRHRKTAKKSHKKKHKRKTKKGKKGKKSKRHTKRRSHKGGAHTHNH